MNAETIGQSVSGFCHPGRTASESPLRSRPGNGSCLLPVPVPLGWLGSQPCLRKFGQTICLIFPRRGWSAAAELKACQEQNHHLELRMSTLCSPGLVSFGALFQCQTIEREREISVINRDRSVFGIWLEPLCRNLSKPRAPNGHERKKTFQGPTIFLGGEEGHPQNIPVIQYKETAMMRLQIRLRSGGGPWLFCVSLQVWLRKVFPSGRLSCLCGVFMPIH